MYLHISLPSRAPAPGSGTLLAASRMQTDGLTRSITVARLTLPVWRVAARTEGCLGVALAADPLHDDWLTLSAWSSDAGLRRFVTSPAHARAVATVEARGGITTSFAFWPGDGAPLRSSWAEAHRRLEEAASTTYPRTGSLIGADR